MSTVIQVKNHSINQVSINQTNQTNQQQSAINQTDKRLAAV
jgi:hypothetical protein